MSQLRLYRPARPETQERPAVFRQTGDDPVIVSFPATYARLRRGAVMNPHVRARVLYENRCCPECRHPVVEPLELNDALFNRNNLPIPGTGTLVGFHCEKCHSEWPSVT